MAHIQNFWNNDDTEYTKNIKCCGCSACCQICPTGAIAMKYDSEGFMYPTINSECCINCGACLKNCPFENEPSEQKYLRTFGGYTRDKQLLETSTSGGFISALAIEIIHQGGIVYGVKYTGDYIKSEYAVARTVDALKEFAGSKYVQSEKNDIYKAVKRELSQGVLVLFVGCPCDVAALKKFLNKDYYNLYTCELVCMGVTSYKIGEEYKEYIEKKEKAVLTKLNARSKKGGWFVPHLEIEFSNGKVTLDSLYGSYYGYGCQVFNRPSCFHCKYRGTYGYADFRVGDFWGIKESDPYWNKDGVCCIFVRSQKGLELLEILRTKGFVLCETEYERATLNNMSSYRNKDEKYLVLREKFVKDLKKRGLIYACRKNGTVGFWIKHIVPERWHTNMKKIYHYIIDK